MQTHRIYGGCSFRERKGWPQPIFRSLLGLGLIILLFSAGSNGQQIIDSTLVKNSPSGSNSEQGGYSSKSSDFDWDLIQDLTKKVGEGSKQISNINVLLPIQNCRDGESGAEQGQQCRHAYKQIYAVNGCYNWKISHPNLVKLTQIQSKTHPQCSNVVEVSNIQPKETKTVVWLTAKDQHSQQILSTQINIAKIQRIEIFSRARQINSGDKQHLEVRAYDDEGNIFSSLDGFRFNWEVKTGGDLVRRIRGRESHLRDQDHSHVDEQTWVQSDDFFFKALKKGEIELSVHILERGYESVPSASIKITVVDPFIVVPAQPGKTQDEDGQQAALFDQVRFDGIIRIPPTSIFDFKLQFVKRSEDESIFFEDIPKSISSTLYNWSIPLQSSNTGIISQQGRFESRNKPGVTAEILVVDKQFLNNTAEVEVQVAEPFILRHLIADVTEKLREIDKSKLVEDRSLQGQLGVETWEKNWLMVEERYYLLKVFLLDQENNLIRLTPNLRFNHSIDDQRLEVVHQNKIESELIVRAKRISGEREGSPAVKSVITSQLKDILTSQLVKFKFNRDKLREETEVLITSPVQISHPTQLILLPLIDSQLWQLQATGGSGTYRWSTNEQTVAFVSEQAQLKPWSEGKTTLVLRDELNHNNAHQIEVEVRKIQRLVWLESQVEALKDSEEEVTLYSIAIDSTGRKFTNCSALQLQHLIEGQAFSLVENFNSPSWLELNQEISNPVSELHRLVLLSQSFNEEPQTQFWESLKQKDLSRFTSDVDGLKLTHNNFGICKSVRIQAKQTGRSVVKAFIHQRTGSSLSDKLNRQDERTKVHSDEVDAIAFRPLTTFKPSYDFVLGDLWANNQTERDLQRLKSLYPRRPLKDYSLVFGSSFDWELIDGGKHQQTLISLDNMGNDNHVITYETTWMVEKGPQTDIDLLEITLLELKPQRGLQQEIQPSSVVNVKCLNPNDVQKMNYTFSYIIELTQKGKLSRSLLRPKTHSQSISLVCEPPRAAKLMWSQISPIPFLKGEISQLLQLAKSRFLNESEVYFVLTNSEHNLKTVLVNSEGSAFIDKRSVFTKFSVSDESLAQISQSTLESLINLMGSLIEGEVGHKQTLKIGNKPGVVQVKTLSQGYLTKYMNPLKGLAAQQGWLGLKQEEKASTAGLENSLNGNPAGQIEAEVTIKIVNSLQIEPRFKSIFFMGKNNPFTFEIKDGSGEFIVSIVDQDQDPVAYLVERGRQITVVPIRVGRVVIEVRDAKLPDSPAVQAELLISSIRRLELHTNANYLEKGQRVNLTLTGFDSSNLPFDNDQYALMDFALRVSDLTRQDDVPYNLVRDLNGVLRVFEVFGKEVGNFQLNAFLSYSPEIQSILSNSNQDVEQQDSQTPTGVGSESVRIEVFPPLRFQPDSLLITPNMRYSIKIEGGPRSQWQGKTQSSDEYPEIMSPLNCHMSESSVASLDQETSSHLREVVGHKVGDVKMTCKVYHHRKHRLGQDQNGEDEATQSSVVVSESQMIIRVRLVTAVEIPNNQNVVYVGSMIKHAAILKYNDETFNNGIGPISYSWNSSHMSILKPDPPLQSQFENPQEGVGIEVSEVRSHSHTRQRTVRNNKANNDFAKFITSFNSSAIFSKALKSGEVVLVVRTAIEYPDFYNSEQNWFDTKILVKVLERLSVSVPEFTADPEKTTHLYLLPPFTKTKIQTNRETQLRIHYSQEKVPVPLTSQQEVKVQDLKKSNEPLVELGKNQEVRTLGRYGQVTLIMEEEQSFGDQIVMLNVLITDIFSMALETFNEVVSLPVDSSLQIPIKFHNQHAHQFAKNIEGISVSFELSHPRVLDAKLDQFNQSLILTPRGIGECNIKIYLTKNLQIFDLLRVKVATIIEPSSPLHVHIGSEVDFKIDRNELDQKQVDQLNLNEQVWFSSNPKVVDINSKSGKARMYDQGRAEVRVLMKGLNATSVVEVSKVSKAAIIDDQVLVLNIDYPQEDLSVNFDLFLSTSDSPLKNIHRLPNTGASIRQNVGLSCDAEFGEFFKASEMVSETSRSGFQCKLNFIGPRDISKQQNIPRKTKVAVSALGYLPKAGGQEKELAYKKEVLKFDLEVVSEIVVEKLFQKSAVELGGNKRTQVVTIRAVQDIQAQVEETVHKHNLYLELIRDSKNSNIFKLKATVPRTVDKEFQATIVLQSLIVGPITKKIKIKFDPKKMIAGLDSQESESFSNEKFEGEQNKRSSVKSGDIRREGDSSASQERKGEKSGVEGLNKSQGPEGRSLSYQVMVWALVIVVTFFVLDNTCRGSAQQFVRLIEQVYSNLVGDSLGSGDISRLTFQSAVQANASQFNQSFISINKGKQILDSSEVRGKVGFGKVSNLPQHSQRGSVQSPNVYRKID